MDDVYERVEVDAAIGRKGRLHGAAVAALREMIVVGELPPGTRLLERELSERLRISRTPLREAIRTLAQEGLVRVMPNRSAIVTDLDHAEVEALYQVVGTIEGLAARLACERCTDEEIAEIGVLHHRMLIHHLRAELPPYVELNQEIHRRIVAMSRNPVLLEMWDILAGRVRHARTVANLIAPRWDAAVREHEEMLVALRARAGDRLGAMMLPHFMNGLAALSATRSDDP
jgi:DNA-binding GntR family transcriptional regulator